ncbi:hypothetical protein ACLOJK_024592 [Asimina triloba]
MAGMTKTEDTELIENVRRVIGPSTLDSDILRALSLAGNNPTAAINLILDTPGFLTGSTTAVKRTSAGAGTRVYTNVKQEVSETHTPEDNKGVCGFDSIKVKEEISEVKQEASETREEMGGFGGLGSIKVKEEEEIPEVKGEENGGERPIKVEDEKCDADSGVLSRSQASIVKNDHLGTWRSSFVDLENPQFDSCLNPRPISCVKPKKNTDRRIQVYSEAEQVETDEFPEEEDWFLVGGTSMVGLSTSRGRKLEFYEVVHFSFPSEEMLWRYSFLSSKAAMARSGIVRFSTKRSGEVMNLTFLSVIGRLPMEWSRCLVPLVNSSKADFTPEELDTRKRSLNLESDAEEGPTQSLAKRRKGNHEQDKNEQVVSEKSLTKLVGASDVYSLEEMDPPKTLTCDLWPYQKQALYWMSNLERGAEAERAAKNLHPCWEAYNIRDKRASAVYLNVFSGEATTGFPSATQMCRGGILADAMGLGKTIMTIALILKRPGWENADEPKNKGRNEGYDSERGAQHTTTVTGGTLVVCPMSLLGQWNDELEAHSEQGAISVLVHYGGDRTSNPTMLSKYDVVLTTYGVLTASYKNGLGNDSIFHKVEWYRVVLDEAHNIKSSRTQAAQATFALTSHCRWCLTGTPLQVRYGLTYAFLWQKLIQKPNDNGDERGLKLVKAILRPILVLPPIDIQLVECEQSEEERDFYDALFQKSKYADLDKLARRFLEGNPSNTTNPISSAPTRAYVEEVVDGIRRGDVVECPICLESADDPVLTPCAHQMCRECLLSSWRTPSNGPCPICRKLLSKAELITCPSGSRFHVDVEKNWKASSKVSKLLNCLKEIRQSGSREKSIVFSQWTSFLDLLQIPLVRNGIGFLRYDGKLAQKQRDMVLKEFSASKEKMDPWWNPAVEEQAIMRIHRIGQKQKVRVRRFIVKVSLTQDLFVAIRLFIVFHLVSVDTVEERLQQVQARKQRMIEGALTEAECIFITDESSLFDWGQYAIVQ